MFRVEFLARPSLLVNEKGGAQKLVGLLRRPIAAPVCATGVDRVPPEARFDRRENAGSGRRAADLAAIAVALGSLGGVYLLFVAFCAAAGLARAVCACCVLRATGTGKAVGRRNPAQSAHDGSTTICDGSCPGSAGGFVAPQIRLRARGRSPPFAAWVRTRWVKCGVVTLGLLGLVLDYPGLRRLLRPCGGVRPRLEGRAAARAADQRPRHLCASGLSARRSLPVRLERGLGDHRRRADQAAGGALQAVAQPGLHRPGLSAADPRDAVRRARPCVPGARRRAAARHLRQHATAVDRVGVGKERQVNARFAAMASHYLFDAEFCNPASGWEKGQVEKNVQDARHRLWQPMPGFATWTR